MRGTGRLCGGLGGKYQVAAQGDLRPFFSHIRTVNFLNCLSVLVWITDYHGPLNRDKSYVRLKQTKSLNEDRLNFNSLNIIYLKNESSFTQESFVLSARLRPGKEPDIPAQVGASSKEPPGTTH